jgi:hypothetical protein
MLISQSISAVDGNYDASEDNPAGTAAYGTWILLPNRSIFDIIPLVLSPDPSTVPFQRVVEACRTARAMLHVFVIDLPEG